MTRTIAGFILILASAAAAEFSGGSAGPSRAPNLAQVAAFSRPLASAAVEPERMTIATKKARALFEAGKRERRDSKPNFTVSQFRLPRMLQ